MIIAFNFLPKLGLRLRGPFFLKNSTTYNEAFMFEKWCNSVTSVKQTDFINKILLQMLHF